VRKLAVRVVLLDFALHLSPRRSAREEAKQSPRPMSPRQPCPHGSHVHTAAHQKPRHGLVEHRHRKSQESRYEYVSVSTRGARVLQGLGITVLRSIGLVTIS
jgi:hypothetical protein